MRILSASRPIQARIGASNAADGWNGTAAITRKVSSANSASDEPSAAIRSGSSVGRAASRRNAAWRIVVRGEAVGITQPIAQRVCIGKLGKAGTRHGRALGVHLLVARRRLPGHRDFLAQHVGPENAADERHQGEGGETDAPRQHGVPGVRWRVDQPSEPSHAYKWHDRCRNRRAADQHRAEMFLLGLPDGSAPSDRDKDARDDEYSDQHGRAEHQCQLQPATFASLRYAK